MECSYRGETVASEFRYNGLGGAGPLFFSLNTRTELLRWSNKDLGLVGTIKFPMIFNGSTDRFEVLEWTRCFNIIAGAVRRIDVGNIGKSPAPVPLSLIPALDIDLEEVKEHRSFQINSAPLLGGRTGDSVLVHLATTLTRDQLAVSTTTLILPCVETGYHHDRRYENNSEGGGALHRDWALSAEEIKHELRCRLSPLP